MGVKRRKKPSLYSRQHKRELNREHLVDLFVLCFACVVVALFVCIVGGFIFYLFF